MSSGTVMAASSSSSASSSAASSSSSRSNSPEVAELPSSSAPTQRPRPNTANTTKYIPPPKYQQATFPPSIALAFQQESPSTSDSHRLSSRDGKQVWIIKIPDGVEPSQLDGLKISLPHLASDRNKPLATLTKERKDGSSGRIKDTYHLFASSPSSSSSTSSKDLPTDARNSQAGLKKGKAERSGEQSQLVDEVEGLTGGAASEGIGSHMHGWRAFVPVGGSQEGLVKASTLPITQHLEFVMAPPDVQVNQGSPSYKVAGKDKAGKKLRELTGYFAPSGSLFDEEAAASTPPIPPVPSVPLSTIPSGGPEKKRKLGEADLDEGVQTSSKKKGKKDRKEESSKGSAKKEKKKKKDKTGLSS